MSYEDIHNRLRAAGLTGGDTGELMAVSYPPEGVRDWNYLPPAQDGKQFDMQRFQARVGLGEWAIRLSTAAENTVYDFPPAGKKLLEDCAERFCVLALNYRE